jgi:hypothetical protein
MGLRDRETKGREDWEKGRCEDEEEDGENGKEGELISKLLPCSGLGIVEKQIPNDQPSAVAGKKRR